MTSPAAAPQPAIAVRVTDVDKYYGTGTTRTQALHGCSLEVRTGEILMLVGPSGCGKTTLLSVIVGILNVDSGNINVFGHEVTTLTGNQKAKFRGKNVGFAFQQFNLLPTLTAAENVAIPLLIANTPRKDALDQAGQWLGKLGLADRLHSLPAELSGGQQQRVAFARALVHNPKLVVCDEPTSSLDGKTGDRVVGMLRDIAVQQDRAVIIVTHDNRIFHHADRIAEMEDGHIIGVHDKKDGTGPFAGLPHPGGPHA